MLKSHYFESYYKFILGHHFEFQF